VVAAGGAGLPQTLQGQTAVEQREIQLRIIMRER